jgi:hypothetical protein
MRGDHARLEALLVKSVQQDLALEKAQAAIEALQGRCGPWAMRPFPCMPLYFI